MYINKKLLHGTSPLKVDDVTNLHSQALTLTRIIVILISTCRHTSSLLYKVTCPIWSLTKEVVLVVYACPVSVCSHLCRALCVLRSIQCTSLARPDSVWAVLLSDLMALARLGGSPTWVARAHSWTTVFTQCPVRGHCCSSCPGESTPA